MVSIGMHGGRREVKIQELEEQSGQPARLIRFLIGEEVVPPPSGGRRFAEYGEVHVKALAVYAAAKAEGVQSLDVIRVRVAEGRATTVFAVAPGIEMHIKDGSVADIADFVERVRKMAAETSKGNIE
jgi:MerR family copper efflux transcriptional regulator